MFFRKSISLLTKDILMIEQEHIIKNLLRYNKIKDHLTKIFVLFLAKADNFKQSIKIKIKIRFNIIRIIVFVLLAKNSISSNVAYQIDD